MKPRRFPVTTLALLALALVLGACSADSPTEPERQPAPPPGSESPSTVWNLTLFASPSEITIDGVNDVTTTVTLFAQRADNNQPPPDGATAVLSTSFGTFAATGTATAAVAFSDGGTAATLTIPGTAETVVIVQAQLEESFAQAQIILAAAPTPEPPAPFFIDSIQPNFGPPGGSRVRINGSGFDPPLRVLFGSTPATIVSASETVITVDTPPVDLEVNQTLTVSVQVTINLNDTEPDQTTQSDTLPNSFTYAAEQVPIPEIRSVTPASGPNEGGTPVVIRGEGFSNQVQVFFGRPTTLVEAQVTNVSSGRIDVVTPAATGINSANRNSIVQVEVINLDSGFSATLASAFQYGNSDGVNIEISAVDPIIGPLEGGNQVRIFGQGFDDPVSVTLAGVLADVRSVSGTEIVVLAGVPPRSAGCVSIIGATTVTNIETNESASGPAYTYEAIVPQILSTSPATSEETGGGTLTIRGLDLPDEEVLVLVDRIEATVLTSSSREITATIPALSRAFPTESCDEDGDGTVGFRNLPLAVDVRVLDLQNGCDATAQGALTYLPDNVECQDDLGPPTASFTASVSGLTVTLVNTSTTGNPLGTSYEWSFGDGNTSMVRDPGSHTYAVAGTYTITLVVKNGVEPDGTASQTVTVM